MTIIIPDQNQGGERPAPAAEADMPGDKLLTTGQAAVALGVVPQTVARWANGGALPCSRTPGGHRRFRSSVIQSLRARLHGGERT